MASKEVRQLPAEERDEQHKRGPLSEFTNQGSHDSFWDSEHRIEAEDRSQEGSISRSAPC